MSKDADGNTGMVKVSSEEMLNRMSNCDFVEYFTVGVNDIDLTAGTMEDQHSVQGGASRSDYYAMAIRNLDPDNSITNLYITVLGTTTEINHGLPGSGETGIMPPITKINGSGNANASDLGSKILVFWLDRKVYNGTAVDKGRINL